ncbi:MAG: transcription elongation factor GreA [Gemmataceae bacterium]|jgi:transcription elongation factor GreA|nr:transcription elongation factor GreA [Gemmataceae bacterium]
MSDERIPMTREGYDKLKKELAYLNDVKMIEITKRVAAARELGDLSENAEYHAAREDQGQLQAKIDELRDRLGRAKIVDPATLPKDIVTMGSRVTVLDLDYEDEEVFTIVGEGEDDADNNKILTTSPIGKGLMGSKVGEQVEIEVPKGIIKFKILKIESTLI